VSAKTYCRATPPRQSSTLLRTGNAADKFTAMDRYVVFRLRRLMIKKRGRNLRAGQALKWTDAWFHDQGLHQLMGTISYPKAA
jgi:RNA-directed DNA polymerase